MRTMTYKIPLLSFCYLAGAPDLVSGAAFLGALSALQHCIRHRYVQAGHDRSDGGLLVALLEMCLAGNLGAEVLLDEAWNTKSVLQGGGKVRKISHFSLYSARLFATSLFSFSEYSFL